MPGGTGGIGASGGAGNGGGAGKAGGGAGGNGGSGVTCGDVNVPLQGLSFDQNTNVWVPYHEGPPPLPIIVSASSLGITAETPPNIAHLGGDDNQYSGMFQTIMIPVGARTMTMTGYRWAETTESVLDPYDYMGIQMWEDALNPVTGTRVGTFIQSDNTMPTNGWVQFMGTISVAAYAGQTVDLDMWGDTDVSNITDFYVDSLSLTAFVCQ